MPSINNPALTKIVQVLENASVALMRTPENQQLAREIENAKQVVKTQLQIQSMANIIKKELAPIQKSLEGVKSGGGAIDAETLKSAIDTSLKETIQEGMDIHKKEIALNNWKDNLQKREKELLELKDEVVQLEKKKNKMQMEIEKMQRDKKAELAEFELKLKDKERTILEREKELSGFALTLSERNERLIERKALLDDRDNDVKSKEAEIDRFRYQLEHKNDIINRLEERIKELEMREEELKDILSKLGDKI